MWTPGYYRFASRAAFLAACQASGWPVEGSTPVPPPGAVLDEVGPLLSPPQITAGVAEPGEVIDARWHVNAAWHGVQPPEAFAAAAVEPATPSRAFALPPPAPPPEPGVPPVVAAWKGKACSPRSRPPWPPPAAWWRSPGPAPPNGAATATS
jgi:hypothetical protein